jgi:hypothetical protein
MLMPEPTRSTMSSVTIGDRGPSTLDRVASAVLLTSALAFVESLDASGPDAEERLDALVASLQRVVAWLRPTARHAEEAEARLDALTRALATTDRCVRPRLRVVAMVA